MSTNELEKCVYLIGYWMHTDKAAIKLLLNNEVDIFKEFTDPFKKELNKNLLTKDTFEGKKDLIKYYMFEFYEIQGMFKRYHDIFYNGSIRNYTPKLYKHTNKEGVERALNEFENYVVNSSILLDVLFNEIQACCIKYNIDFYLICEEINFSLEYFDSSITLIFEESQSINLSPQSPMELNKLSALLTHQKSTEIVEGIKIQYKNIKGKQLKLLLLALQDLGLLPIERIAKKFHSCCKAEFGWNIASYNAMNGYNYNDSTDNEILENKKKYIEAIIK